MSLRRAVLLATAAGLLPSAASAHLVQSGLGPFYDGLLHPLISLEDLLPVLALAVLAGLRGAANARWLLLVVPLAWLLGYATGGAVPASRPVLLAVGVFGVLVGMAAAAAVPVPRAVLLATGAVLGFAHGLVVGPAVGWLAVAGSAVTVGAVIAVVSGEVSALGAAWTRIAARVLASWTAAAGMLQLGWMLRG